MKAKIGLIILLLVAQPLLAGCATRTDDGWWPDFTPLWSEYAGGDHVYIDDAGRWIATVWILNVDDAWMEPRGEAGHEYRIDWVIDCETCRGIEGLPTIKSENGPLWGKGEVYQFRTILDQVEQRPGEIYQVRIIAADSPRGYCITTADSFTDLCPSGPDSYRAVSNEHLYQYRVLDCCGWLPPPVDTYDHACVLSSVDGGFDCSFVAWAYRPGRFEVNGEFTAFALMPDGSRRSLGSQALAMEVAFEGNETRHYTSHVGRDALADAVATGAVAIEGEVRVWRRDLPASNSTIAFDIQRLVPRTDESPP